MSAVASIVAINSVGQSVWYDNLSRDILTSGELSGLIEKGVSGLTSNPTIFKKAIADSSHYDSRIKELSAKGLSTEDLTEELMIEDVAAAADLLLPIYNSSNGTDGHASIEVSPFLARDSINTVVAAKRLWSKLARPNIMIKIPGTPECLAAIREVLAAGINVNVTLLFSQQDYEQVAEEFLVALESRAAKNESIDKLASVASFFVSRVDSICESRFAELSKSGSASKEDEAQFVGKIGIANAKLAYQSFLQIFGSPRFATLKKKGAQFQRPLWASTGTKNPALPPLLYVKELAGEHTVNTMPPQTLKFLVEDPSSDYDNSVVARLSEAKVVSDSLNKIGLPLGALLHRLQDDGVELFSGSYKDLLAAVEKKASALK